MSDAILAGLGGLGDVAKTAIGAAQNQERIAIDEKRLGLEERRVAITESTFPLERQRLIYENQKLKMGNDEAMMPMNFTGLAKDEMGKKAIEGNVKYIQENYPDIAKDLYQDKTTGNWFGPRYIGKGFVQDINTNTELQKKNLEIMRPMAAQNAMDKKGDLDKLKEKLKEKYGTQDVLQNDENYKKAFGEWKEAQDKYDNFVAQDMAIKRQEEQIKAEAKAKEKAIEEAITLPGKLEVVREKGKQAKQIAGARESAAMARLDKTLTSLEKRAKEANKRAIKVAKIRGPSGGGSNPLDDATKGITGTKDKLAPYLGAASKLNSVEEQAKYIKGLKLSDQEKELLADSLGMFDDEDDE
jgi:hypothetical protein